MDGQGGSITTPISQASGNLTGDDLDALIAAEVTLLNDPVSWAEERMYHPEEAYQPLRLREFQKIILRDTEHNMALRIGRQSGKSILIAIKAIHTAFINPGKPVIIVVQSETLQRETYKVIKQMLGETANGILWQSVVAKGEKPFYRITFSTGSEIKVFLISSNSKTPGSGIRGQRGHGIIIIDECDYIDSKALVEVIMPIMTSKPDIKLWVSSTPLGDTNTFFYKVCTDAERAHDLAVSTDTENTSAWRHFHIPAWHANPNWSEKMEKEVRSKCDNEEQFIREYGAEFTTQDLGVFRVDLVQDSVVDGTQPLRELDELVRYVEIEKARGRQPQLLMGVDWNGYAIGVKICVSDVVENERGEPFLKLVFEKTISGLEFTQCASVDFITALVTGTNCMEAVVVDNGWGAMQIEELKRWADHQRNQKYGLREMLEAMIHHSNIEFFNEFTQEKVKTNVLQFMVNNTATLLENDMVRLPDIESKVAKQMISYRIVRLNQRREPIYAGEDHELVAFFYNCYAFTTKILPKYAGLLGFGTGAVSGQGMYAAMVAGAVNRSIREAQGYRVERNKGGETGTQVSNETRVSLRALNKVGCAMRRRAGVGRKFT